MNRFAQTKHTPYLLETDNLQFGAYEDLHTAKGIGRAKLANKEISRYVVRDINGNIVDEG